VRILSLSDIDVVITDKGLPQAAVEAIEAMGIELILV
jgi:DeoR/GlpR family transcriptional regulator of sugar metabolism